jgi:hypothetical protein
MAHPLLEEAGLVIEDTRGKWSTSLTTRRWKQRCALPDLVGA